MRSKRDIALNLLLFGGIILGFLAFSFFTNEPGYKTVSFDGPNGDLPLQSLADKNKSLLFKHLRGQNVVLHFGATWCKACESDPPYLNELASESKATDFKVISISSDDPGAKLLNMAQYEQFADPTGQLALYLGIKNLPHTLIIDSQGRILTQISSALDSTRVSKLKDLMLRIKAPSIGEFGPSPKFELVNSQGNKFTHSELTGKAWVINFIFTRCPSQCPTMTARLAQFQKEFEKEKHLKFVSVSVDPNHDTPPVLRSYAEKFKYNPDSWYFLTGPFGSVKKLIGRGFKLGTPEDPQLHTSKFVLVDKDQKIRGYYDSTNPTALDKLKRDLKQILN
jgi:protein SCO1/2